MSDIDLAWRVEEACLNAWPSQRQLLVHGYLLRAAGGTSKRQNSLNPMRGSGQPEPAIRAGEAVYAALGRRAIFRVPGIAPQMEPLFQAALTPSRTRPARCSGTSTACPTNRTRRSPSRRIPMPPGWPCGTP